MSDMDGMGQTGCYFIRFFGVMPFLIIIWDCTVFSCVVFCQIHLLRRFEAIPKWEVGGGGELNKEKSVKRICI